MNALLLVSNCTKCVRGREPGAERRGAVLAFAYSLGLGLPFLLAAFSVSGAMRRLAWARLHVRAIARAGGGFLIVLGVLQLTGVWSEWMAAMQALIAGWQPPI